MATINETNSSYKQRFVNTLTANGQKIHSHAYIIEGDEGAGKLEFAVFCAAAIFCGSDFPPCRKCRSCKKVFAQGHPDIHIFGGEGGKPVTMKEVRDLIASSVLLPNDSDKKIYIIRSAEKMRPDTQNAILKIFEEPPASVVIFLLTRKKEALLPTILSRGRLITLTGESDDFIKQAIRKKHPSATETELNSAVKASGGSLGQALSFFSKENTQARTKALSTLDTLFGSSRLEFLSLMIQEKHTREKLLDQLNLLERLIADILELKLKSNAYVILDSEQAEMYGEKITKRALGNMIDCIKECRNTLEQNGNINASVTNLSIKLWNAKI